MRVLIAVVVWVIGLLTAVPYAAYRLVFLAPVDEYPWLITFVLFWIFGYWGLAAPVLALIKLRRIFRALEAAQSEEAVGRILTHPESIDLAVDLIASENRLPKFVVRYACRRFLERRLTSLGDAT